MENLNISQFYRFVVGRRGIASVRVELPSPGVTLRDISNMLYATWVECRCVIMYEMLHFGLVVGFLGSWMLLGY